MRSVVGGENDLFFFVNDLGLGVFQIEAGGQFFARLIEGVVDFLLVHFGDDVEGRHLKVCQGFASAILMLPSVARISMPASLPSPTNMSILVGCSPLRCSFSVKSLSIFQFGVSATKLNEASLGIKANPFPSAMFAFTENLAGSHHS